MSRSRFPIFARLDEASRTQQGTVTIDRNAETFAVRPKRRRREYTLPLGFVASLVVRHVLKVELAERKAAKRQKRKARL